MGIWQNIYGDSKSVGSTSLRETMTNRESKVHDVAERQRSGSKSPENDRKRAQPRSSKLRNMEGDIANEDACSQV